MSGFDKVGVIYEKDLDYIKIKFIKDRHCDVPFDKKYYIDSAMFHENDCGISQGSDSWKKRTVHEIQVGKFESRS
jgi:hypothetical protein